MNIALIQCPSWGTYMLSLGVAYLSAYLKEKGYNVKVFDLNIQIF